MDNLVLNQIDFKWTDETNDPRLLRKGLKLLKEDGGYFPDLEKYIEEKLKKVDNKFKSLNQAKNEKIDPEELKKYVGDISSWESDIGRADKIISGKSDNEIFSNEKNRVEEISNIEKKKLAENEKIKGNDLMKTKEFDEAIRFYTNSINLDPQESTTYCNRALAFLKLKQYEKALIDCNKAIELKNDYAKAYFRRSACLLELNKITEAFYDLLYILKDTPSNDEILNELKNLKEKWFIFEGKNKWQEMSSTIESKIEYVKNPINKSKMSQHYSQFVQEITELFDKPKSQIETNVPSSGGFKKIKIIEETIEVVPTDKEISQALKNQFEKFMKSGETIKVELERLMDNKQYKKADEIARECLKDCQNFIKEFKAGSKYHLQIEKAIEDINSLITMIQKQTEEKTEILKNKDELNNDTHYYKTKLLSEGIRENATKLIELNMNFSDFPKTSYGFEKAFNSMKKRVDLFFNYLKHFGGKNISIIYKDNELPYQILIGVLEALQKYGVENMENVQATLEYLEHIPKTKNFSLLKKFLKKSDKENMRGFLQQLSSNFNEIFGNKELDKIYL